VVRVKSTTSSVPNLSSQKEEDVEGLERYKNYVYDSEKEEKTTSKCYTAGLATQEQVILQLNRVQIGRISRCNFCLEHSKWKPFN